MQRAGQERCSHALQTGPTSLLTRRIAATYRLFGDRHIEARQHPAIGEAGCHDGLFIEVGRRTLYAEPIDISVRPIQPVAAPCLSAKVTNRAPGGLAVSGSYRAPADPTVSWRWPQSMWHALRLRGRKNSRPLRRSPAGTVARAATNRPAQADRSPSGGATSPGRSRGSPAPGTAARSASLNSDPMLGTPCRPSTMRSTNASPPARLARMILRAELSNQAAHKPSTVPQRTLSRTSPHGPNGGAR